MMLAFTGLLAGCGDHGDAASTSVAIPVTTAAAPVPSPTPTPIPASAPVPAGAPATVSAVIVQSGDSIGAGFTAGYAAVDHLGFPASVAIDNVSTDGEGLQTALGRRGTDLFPLYDAAVPSTLLLQQGTNDLGPGSQFTGTYLYADLTSFVALAKAAGFYVVVDTILPRQDANWTAAMEQERLVYNGLVRGNNAGADAINDIAADPLIGDGTGPATSSFYTDGLHPSLLGQQRLAMLDAAVLASFLQARPRAAR